MEFALKNKDQLLHMYEKGYSSYEMANELNTYSTRVLRALSFLGEKFHGDSKYYKRSYSEAQKLALERGRSQHPTRGKKLNATHKENIGKSRSQAYHALSEQEKQRLSQLSKDNWKALGKAKQEEIRSLALEGVRYASKHGSKTERHIQNGLSKAGYSVEFHKNGLVPGSNLEVDLFVSELKTAIEIDGPGHFLPIWGEEKLQKQQSSDTIKQGVLLSNGYVILRIRQIDKNISLTRMNYLLELILEELEKIQEKFPDSNKRLIEIEVHDGETRRIQN